MNKELYDLSFQVRMAFKKKILSIFSFLIFTSVAINLILHFLVFPVREKSVSMQPDIPPSAMVFFSPLAKTYRRGSVVLVYQMEGLEVSKTMKFLDRAVGFFTARQVSIVNSKHWMGSSFQIRRILALPGDSIFMKDHVLYIKPKGSDFPLTEFELLESPYNVSIAASPAFWDSSVGVKGSFDEITLSDDEYYVLADNRNSSVDSRLWGPVKKENIKAVALLEYFPFRKLRLFR